MLRVIARRYGGMSTSTQHRVMAKAVMKDLKRVTPVDTRALQRGWKITSVNALGFEITDDVYYGYWQEYGNTRGLKGRYFVTKMVEVLKRAYPNYRFKIEAKEEKY